MFSRKYLFTILFLLGCYTVSLFVFRAGEVCAKGPNDSAPGVRNGSHGFTASNGNGLDDIEQADQMCGVCHTPRNVGAVEQQWSKSAKSSRVAMYPSRSLDMQSPKAPNDSSALCLSCHDGSVASDQLGNGPGKTIPAGFRALINGSASTPGNDLSDDHPVSIRYDSTDTNNFHRAVGGRVGPLPLFGENNDQVECSTCHDHHSGRETYLRVENSGSALCLTCHVK